jgi:hypothetical protein
MYLKIKTFSLSFAIQSNLNGGDALPQQLFIFALEYVIRKVQETRWD